VYDVAKGESNAAKANRFWGFRDERLVEKRAIALIFLVIPQRIEQAARSRGIDTISEPLMYLTNAAEKLLVGRSMRLT